MMGAMNTNLGDAFKTGIHVEGHRKMNTVYESINVEPRDLNEVAGFCTSITYGKGASIINGACIAVDNGWTCVVG